MGKNIANYVLQIIQQEGPVNAQRIKSILVGNYGLSINKTQIHSLLYGQLNQLVIRDKDDVGLPTWRLKGNTFEAASGLEVMFYRELLRRNIITGAQSQLDYQIQNPRNNKTYHLDIAIFLFEKKYDIEIDGFEHMRADARLSIQKQIGNKGENCDIEIDWMDNETSFADFKTIDSGKVFKWCITHRDWCIRYHEELIKPHDITRNIFLIENGWSVIRFWNFQIKEEMQQCVKLIQNWISK